RCSSASVYTSGAAAHKRAARAAMRYRPAAPNRRPMPDSQRPATHKWVITGTVLLGTLMAVLDSSIVNVALPAMRGTLGATVEEITWVVTGYILASVIIM